VKTALYFASTVEDHIAPWRSTDAGAKLFASPVRFVLGGSGHIAGIVNPPAAKKYHYWTNEARPDAADDWFKTATQHPGSWWEDWQAWMDARNGGEKVPARTPQNALEDAPGSYVMLRLGRKPAA
jgi:polyhydroxyalkanoate synthase